MSAPQARTMVCAFTAEAVTRTSAFCSRFMRSAPILDLFSQGQDRQKKGWNGQEAAVNIKSISLLLGKIDDNPSIFPSSAANVIFSKLTGNTSTILIQEKTSQKNGGPYIFTVFTLSLFLEQEA